MTSLIQADPQNSHSRSLKIIILVTTSISVFFTAFTTSALNVALPTVNKEFGASAILLSWVVTIYLLAVGVLQLPFGRLADILGIKRIYTIGAILFALGSITAIFANTILVLIISQVIRGIGGAMIFGNATALLTVFFPKEVRGRVFGINMAFVYSGFTMGPFLGGVLTEHVGWRSIFIFTALAFVIVTILMLWKVKDEWRQCKGEKFDVIGAVIFCSGMVVFMYGFSNLPGTSGIICTLIGAVGLVLFIMFETNSQKPLLNISVFRRNRLFILSNLATWLNYCSVASVVFLLSLYLQYIKGFSADQAGLILLLQPATQIILSLVAGKLSDKISPVILSTIGMALIFVPLCSFIFINAQTSIVLLIITLLVFGTGYGLFASPNSNVVMSSVSKEYFGVAAATQATMRTMGQTTAMAITMIVINAIIGQAVITPDNYPGFLNCVQIAFIIFSFICLSGIVVCFYQRTAKKS